MHAVTGTGRLISGRYRLQDPIGRGAMGIVWRGRDELLAREVAIKEVQITGRASPADAEVIYQRTLREARTAARLNHPGVVTVFDVVEENGSPWIVMELIEARSLDQVITEDGPLPPEQAAELGTILLSALATAHSAGVLHRDVKPSNVLVTGEGRAVLTDFGIATFAEDPGMTQAGMVVGTPGFTAPERIRGDIATPASDLWSLGATLYAAVEGRGPFDRVGGSSVISAGVAGEDAPRAPSAGPLGPVIEALLSRDPGTRPDSATAARLLADAATAARTGPRPLSDGWLAAEAGREDAATGPAAGQMGTSDSGFLDPPDYNVLQIPGAAEAPLAADATRDSGELALVGTVAAGSALAATESAQPPTDSRAASARAAASGAGNSLDPASGPALWGPVTAGSGGRPGSPPPGPTDPGQGGIGPLGSGWGTVRGAWRSSAKWRLMVAAAGIAAIVVAAVIGWSIFQHSGPASSLSSASPPGTGSGGTAGGSAPAGPHGSTGNRAAAGPQGGAPAGGHSSAGPSGMPGGGPSGTQGGSPGTPTSTPSSSGSPGPTVTPSPGSSMPILPAGYRWHTFSAAVMGSVAGFEIGVPDSWTDFISGQAAHLNQSVRGFHLTVDLGNWLYTKPLRQAQYLQTLAAQAHTHGYKLLTLTATGFTAVGGYTSASAAELKYTWRSPSLGSNFTELVILVMLATKYGSQPYTFSLWAPSATFSTANGVFETAMPTFRPLP